MLLKFIQKRDVGFQAVQKWLSWDCAINEDWSVACTHVSKSKENNTELSSCLKDEITLLSRLILGL